MTPETDDRYDLAIIGAGINGAGIARDAAMRGLRIAILEQDDLCSGTSAWSSRLIHGGLRYLEYAEVPLVFESLRERRTLRKIAPHLVKPLRITIPIYTGARRGPLLIRTGMLLYDLLSSGKSMPAHDMLDRDEMQFFAPGLNSVGLRAGARYFDAQVTFAERLVLENLLAAKAAGATILTRHRVTGIDIQDGAADALQWENTLSGATGRLRARVVINASGPWVDQVLGVTGRDADRLIGGTKGSHIVVGSFAGAPDDAFYIEAAADGRPIFIIPWNGQFLIGTTDIRTEERLEDLRASRAEIDYLLAETNRVFPQAALGIEDIHFAYAGVRPLPYRTRGPESAITRKHIIKRNRKIASNLLSIVGGKLTTYRSLAEQAVDRVARLLHRRLPECRTHDTPLPGGSGLEDVRRALEAEPGLAPACRARLLDLYGRRANAVVTLARKDGLKTLDPPGAVLAGEVRHSIRAEFAQTLTDIAFRRLMVGLSADQGRPIYAAIAELAAQELGWDSQRRTSELEALTSYADSLLPPGN